MAMVVGSTCRVEPRPIDTTLKDGSHFQLKSRKI